MIRTIVLLAVICLSSLVYGQNTPPVLSQPTESPSAIIVGPDKVGVGQSAWLKTTGSLGKNFKWQVIPPEESISFTELPVYGGMDRQPGPDEKLNTTDDILTPIVHNWAHFESAKEGTFYFILVVTDGDRSSIAVHALVNGKVQPTPTPGPDPPVPVPVPEPDINVDTPTAYFQNLVKDIPSIVVGSNAKIDSKELAKFYLDMASVIGRDTSVVKTTEHIRTLNINAGKLMFQQSGIQGRYANLNTTVDNVITQSLGGLENVALTVDKRNSVVKAFEALAWGFLQIK